MSYYRNQLEDWLKTISVKTERVLDLGGATNPVESRIKSWEVQECIFMDTGVEVPKVDFIPFDINLPFEGQLPGFANDPWKKNEHNTLFTFDAIFCLEVFEYVWNPVQAIKNIWDFMNQDSVAYISFPAIYPVHQPFEYDYLRYTKKAIEKYLAMFPFTQIEITPRIATLGRTDLANFYTNEKMHPLRGSELPLDIGYLVKARKLTLA